MRLEHYIFSGVVGLAAAVALLFGISGALAGETTGAFGKYREIPVSLPDAYKGYTLPVNASDIANLAKLKFSPDRVNALKKDGFFVQPGDWKEFYQVYDNGLYSEIPSFITTDSMLHVFHLVFDKILRDLERERFAPDTRALTTACRIEAEGLYNQLKGTELAEPARRVLAYFSVAEGLITPGAPVPPAVADVVKKELALVNGAEGFNKSAVFSLMTEDYTQYIPRGHYTKSEDLKRYFKTMMYYGRMTFRLKNDDETKMALLVTYILKHAKTADGRPASTLWERVYEPTSFFVGGSDDPSFVEYGAISDAVFGKDAAPERFADKSLLAEFIDRAKKLPAPRINSMWVTIFEDRQEAIKGFRFMGSRFVIDAYIFENLIWRRVGTLDNPRMLPSALDAMAVMGSREAYAILDGKGETKYANYKDNMEKMRVEIAALPPGSWTTTLYSAWLYTLVPLVEAKDGRYPAFMQGEKWATKSLNSAVGSYTELKHDTILYSKQVMAEAGGEEPPQIQNWVEPEPYVWARLLSLVRMMNEGLASRGLLSEAHKQLLENLDSDVSFLLGVTNKELKGLPVPQEDNDRMMYWGEHLEYLTLAAADTEGEGRPYFEDADAALVADIATDPTGYVLEVATGRINEIYVVVPDGKGRLTAARGGVFSTYEFTVPMAERMTDDTWKARLGKGDVPPAPGWTKRFMLK